MRTSWLVVLLVAVSGCVHVNMPEHLVSDTVDAGKDAVHAIARTLDKKPAFGVVESNSKHTSYWLAQQGSADQTVGQLQQACIAELLAQTQPASFQVAAQKVEATTEGIVVRCQIDVSPVVLVVPPQQ